MFLIYKNNIPVIVERKCFKAKRTVRKMINHIKSIYNDQGAVYVDNVNFHNYKVSFIPYNFINPIERHICDIKIVKIKNK